MRQVIAILILAVGIYPVIVPLVWLFIRKISQKQTSNQAMRFYSGVIKNIGQNYTPTTEIKFEFFTKNN